MSRQQGSSQPSKTVCEAAWWQYGWTVDFASYNAVRHTLFPRKYGVLLCFQRHCFFLSSNIPLSYPFSLSISSFYLQCQCHSFPTSLLPSPLPNPISFIAAEPQIVQNSSPWKSQLVVAAMIGSFGRRMTPSILMQGSI
jgi:hypothetical protein